MTLSTSTGLRQTLAYTCMAKDDLGTFLGLRQTLTYIAGAKDDPKYFYGAQADPSVHLYG